MGRRWSSVAFNLVLGRIDVDNSSRLVDSDFFGRESRFLYREKRSWLEGFRPVVEVVWLAVGVGVSGVLGCDPGAVRWFVFDPVRPRRPANKTAFRSGFDYSPFRFFYFDRGKNCTAVGVIRSSIVFARQ